MRCFKYSNAASLTLSAICGDGGPFNCPRVKSDEVTNGFLPGQEVHSVANRYMDATYVMANCNDLHDATNVHSESY